MADELATAEATASEETQLQTPEVEGVTLPEADTPTDPEAPIEPDRGDPRIAMQEERRKRQELESRLSDPQFVYEAARKLGLAQDDTPSSVPLPAAQNAPTSPGIPDVASIVEHQLDYLRTVEKYPEFDRDSGDQALVKWAATLVNDGHKPSQAVDIIRKTIQKQAGKMSSDQVRTTLDAKAESEALKLSADAITSTTTATANEAEIEELNLRASNWKDPVAQEAAILEKMKRSMKVTN